MNYKSPEINLNIETQAQGKFVLVQCALMMTPELALTMCDVLRELRSATPEDENQDRAKLLDEVLERVRQVAKEIAAG